VGLHVVDHPLLAEALAVLRDRDTGAAAFRAAAHAAAALLFHEAARDLPSDAGTVQTPLGRAAVRRVRARAVTLVPVLRAGLGMLAGVLPLVPGARVVHLGIRRDEKTLEPQEYYRNLPASVAGSLAFVLDPTLATGGTTVRALEVLRDAGAREARVLAVIAAPEGVRTVRSAFSEAEIFVAAVDERLDERGYIVPGLGDAGDRLFATEA